MECLDPQPTLIGVTRDKDTGRLSVWLKVGGKLLSLEDEPEEHEPAAYANHIRECADVHERYSLVSGRKSGSPDAYRRLADALGAAFEPAATEAKADAPAAQQEPSDEGITCAEDDPGYDA